MNLLEAIKRLRDDIKTWVIVNLNALNNKIDEKTFPVDNRLDSTSTNPVQNKVITKALNNVPRFSGDYNDLTNAPNIAEDDSGNLVITDESGNIIFKADAEGIHTTALSLNGESAATEAYVDEAVASIPEVNLTGYATEDFVTQSIENVKADISESITSESEDWKIVDEAGNIILNVNAEGVHTTNLTLNGENAATESYVDNKVADLVNSAPEALDTLGELAAALENHEDAYDALLETVGNKATHTDLENLKEELSESITAEAEDWKVVDGNGNIIFSVDNTGAHTTNLTLNGEEAATEAYVNEAIANIDFPEADLSDYYTKDQIDEAIKTVNVPDSDWDAADGEPGHIKNRTHWIERVYTNVMSDTTSEVDEEIGAAAFMADLVIGKTYRVKWNGSFHICTADAFEEVGFMGGDSYPFAIDFFEGSLDAYPKDGSTIITMAIDEVTEIIHKIPAKFLPASTEETDPTVPAWAKEATKPSYTADEVGALSKDTPLFSGDYNDLENAPDITEDGSGNLIIADEQGNIILQSNGDGFETVNLTVQNITINGVTIQEMIKDYVDEAILGGAW